MHFVLLFIGPLVLRHMEPTYDCKFTPVILLFLRQFFFTIVLDSQQNREVGTAPIILISLYKPQVTLDVLPFCDRI